jgi:hypothetical protein
MTPYDRWKLATPLYLEDTDEAAEEESLHDTDADGEDGADLPRSVKLDTPDAGKGFGAA